MKLANLTLAFLMASVFTTGSFAADKQPTQKKVQYRKTQEVSFDAQDVDGELRSPDGSFVNPQKGVRFMPVYKVDKRFDKAIKESPEFLR